MPEIFDQNHDWIGVLLSKEPKESHLFTFFAVPSTGLLLVERHAGPLPDSKMHGYNVSIRLTFFAPKVKKN